MMKNSLQKHPITLGSVALITLSIIQLIGLYVSDILTNEHIGLKLGDKTDSGLCGASEFFSCKAAAASVYSQVGELPIAVIGEAYYLCVLLAIVIARFIPKVSGEIYLTLGLTSILGALYSLFLGTVSLLDLGFLCPLCIGLYGVNLGTLAIIWWGGSIRPKLWSKLIFKPMPWGILVLMVLSLVGTQSLYASRFKAQYKVAKHKLEKAQKPEYQEIELGQAPVRGENSAALIIEFSDFQCPFCKRFTKNLKKAFEGAHTHHPFSYAFKHYPLSSQCNPHIKRDMHPRACHAAMASICAQNQGQFWAMHDLLFEHQHELEDEDLKSYALHLKLDMPQFIDCLSSEQTQEKLSEDIKLGAQVGVRGTPVFFVNGWGFKGAKGPKSIHEAVGEYAYGVKPASDIKPETTDKDH